MKEIIAIIRPKQVTATKNILDAIGLSGMTASAVLGRGKQKGIANEIRYPISPAVVAKGQSMAMKYVPKRLLNIVVNDEDVDKAVKAIIKVNQTTQFGDGKIFVCPVDNAVRVRTKDEGKAALN